MNSIDQQSQQEAQRDSQGAAWGRNGQRRRLETIEDRQAKRMPPNGKTHHGVVAGAGIVSAPVVLGKTKSIGDVLAELATRGQAPIHVGHCRIDGCDKRGWIEDSAGWLCANHMHQHATNKPQPSKHPIPRIVDDPPVEPPKQAAPIQVRQPMRLLPPPKIVGLLPSGLSAAALPPAEVEAPAVATTIIEFPAHQVIAVERAVNPEWIAAFKAVHGLGLNRGEVLKTLMDDGSPEAYVMQAQPEAVQVSAAPVSASAVPPAAKPTPAPFETNPKIAPIEFTSVDTMPGLIPAAPYAANDIEAAYQQRIETVRRMRQAEKAVA